jgi:hypothetical protein
MRHEIEGSRSTKTKNLEVNRHLLLSHNAKMLCKSCQTLCYVADFYNSVGEAKLSCGHRRGLDVAESAQSVAAA